MNVVIILAGILVSIFLAVRPVKLGRVPLNTVTGPLLVLGVLLLCGCLEWSHLWGGMAGRDRLRPWEILIIFYTTAYVSISVDLSGILDFFAFRIVRRARGRGLLLFFLFYGFASLLTVFTSNDIVILTLTPIIFYLKKHADIEITPLLFAEFFGANTLSMLLYIGNPTNIIVGNALGLDFPGFSRIMAWPTLTAALFNILLLYLVFRGSITRRFVLKEDSKVQLRSIYDSVVSSGLLLAMLGFLLFSERLGLPIWWVTLGFALLYIIEDLVISMVHIVRDPRRYVTELSADMKQIYAVYGFPSNRYDLFVIAKRLPWKILPFITVIFILVYALADYGFVTTCAGVLANLSQRTGQTVLINGGLGLLLSNLINNQPASILYSSILADPAFRGGGGQLLPAAYAVIMATNLGANLTLIGALAGILWEKILQEKGIRLSYREFLYRGLLITPLVMLLSLAVLYLVLRSAGY